VVAGASLSPRLCRRSFPALGRLRAAEACERWELTLRRSAARWPTLAKVASTGSVSES
jgi:hypothetical protein